MFKSIRWRLQIWHTAILLMVVVSFATILYWQQWHSRFREVETELDAAAQLIVTTLRSAPRPMLEALLRDRSADSKNQTATDLDQFVEQFSMSGGFGRPPRPPFGRARHPGGRPPMERDFDGAGPGRAAGPDRGVAAQDRRGPPVRRFDHRIDFAILRDDGTIVRSSNPGSNDARPRQSPPRSARESHFQHRGDRVEVQLAGPMRTRVVVGQSIEPELRRLSHLLLWIVAIGSGVMVVGCVGGWVLSNRAIRPIRDISDAAADISASNLSRRIEAEKMDSELGDLAETLNATFARLESAFEQQSQFTADASHELRTPLSVISMHTELALSKERSPEQYREALEVCQRATQRMNSLVESLLTLARVDSGELVLARRRIDVGKIANDCLELVRPVAESNDIQLETNLSAVFADADGEKLAQVFTNLLTNAITYNRAGGRVSISVTENKNEDAIITISDTGVGIPESDLAQIFRRFYRVDKNRSRDAGGSGLGLSICKLIVESHGGSITAHSDLGAGSTFQVALPGGSGPTA